MPGTYKIQYSVDDQTFVDTGVVWVASATSLVPSSKKSGGLQGGAPDR